MSAEKKQLRQQQYAMLQEMELNIMPIEEAIQKMHTTSTADPTKTSVSELKELEDRGIIMQMEYSAISKLDDALTTTFVIRLRLQFNKDIFESTGYGRSKAACKLDASNKMVQTLNSHSPFFIAANVSTTIAPPTPSERNSIVLLQEHLQKKGASAMPFYADVDRRGPEHIPEFTVSCTVDGHLEHGTASTKRAARHLAAHNMCVQLQIYK